MKLEQEIHAYAAAHAAEQLELLKALCAIPAPSNHEEKRAEFCRDWLVSAGLEGVYIDEALNVVCPINCENSNAITVFVAHTDTVFPDTEPMPYVEKDGKVFCPGVGDDTACLVCLMMAARYLHETAFRPREGFLIVCNSGEEGLGNLKGTRQIMEQYQGRVKQFISFDGTMNAIADVCVGSHRYAVEVRTVGGHSFQKFGNPNAIAQLAELVSEIYQIEVPKEGNSRTTYNVGKISGGTSVNTIAQYAEMLCEYRSDNVKCLSIMQARFEKIFADAKAAGMDITVTKVGDRPCASSKLDAAAQARLCDLGKRIVEEVTGKEVGRHSGSTDCNIPMAMAIPAVCLGTYVGGGAHTREEWVEKESFPQGLEVAIRTMLALSEN